MKLFLLTVLVSVISCCAYAQSTSRQNVVTVNAGAIIGVSNVSYERAVSKRLSFIVSPSFSLVRAEAVNYVTWGAGGGFRIYVLKDKSAPQGLYISPVFSYATGTATVETTGQKTDIAGFSTQGFAGYQWILRKGFTINVAGGLQYLRLDYKTDNNLNLTSKLAYSGLLPGIIGGIGYAF